MKTNTFTTASGRYIVESYGNGWAYTITDQETGANFFVQDDSAVDISQEIARLQKKSQALTKDIYARLNAWQISQVARHPQRPYTLDYVQRLFTGFEELHGDRAFGDDPAIVGGLARFNDETVMVIGHQKGRDTKERMPPVEGSIAMRAPRRSPKAVSTTSCRPMSTVRMRLLPDTGGVRDRVRTPRPAASTSTSPARTRGTSTGDTPRKSSRRNTLTPAGLVRTMMLP